MKGIMDRIVKMGQYVCVNALISPVYGTVENRQLI